MPKNRERRKEVGKIFFDLSKYLLTTGAISSFIVKEPFNIKALIIGLILSAIAMVVAYYIYPLDKED